jgi:hypothetical protein
MIDANAFAVALDGVSSDTHAIYVEHLADNEGEVLLHPLVAMMRDRAIVAFDRDEIELLHRLLDVMALGLEDGDELVRNAVEISFVEDSCWYDAAMAPFIASWPDALRAEVRRQQSSNPGGA